MVFSNSFMREFKFESPSLTYCNPKKKKKKRKNNEFGCDNLTGYIYAFIYKKEQRRKR